MQDITAEVEPPLVAGTAPVVAHTGAAGNRPRHFPARSLSPAAVDTLARMADTVAGRLGMPAGLTVLLLPCWLSLP